MEAGGIKALFEAGIYPSMVVGSSVGALNAVWLAAAPTPAGIEHLCALWRSLQTRDLVPGGRLTRVWRLLTGQLGIFTQEPLKAFLRKQLPPGVETFGDLPTAVAVYVTAASLQTSSLYLYGEDRTASLLDALLATSAFPGGFPPLQHGRWQFGDGGILANVPIGVAVDKGATTIYALDVAYTGGVYGPARNAIDVVVRTASLVLHCNLIDELEKAAQPPGVTVHHIVIRGVPEAGDFCFDRGAEMVSVSYERVRRYLDGLAEGTRTTGRVGRPVVADAPAPPGARLWIPPARRLSPLPDPEGGAAPSGNVGDDEAKQAS